MIGRTLSLAMAALLACAAVSPAQDRRAERAANQAANQAAKQAAKQAARAEGRGGRAGAGADANQQALAKQIRQAFAGVVRKRLNLTDDQARQLDATQQRFQQQRTQVQRDERQARLGLKAAMEDTTAAPDQAKISAYMDQLVQAQHRRAAILEAEQKELAGYLTPLQRAQYQALHEQLNKRIQQMQQQAAGANAVPTP